MQKKIQDNIHSQYIRKITYRPFDFRYIYYSPDVIDWGREKILENLKKPNIAIISARSNKSGRVDHFYITEDVAEAKCGESTTQSTVFPLFIDSQTQKVRTSNLDFDIIKKIASKVNLIYQKAKNQVGIKEDTFGPYDVIYYTYAVMNSTCYREKYKEQLAMDFPIIPFPTSKEQFDILIQLGHDIKKIHLMEFDDKVDTAYDHYSGNSLIEKYKFEGTYIAINHNQSFMNITDDDWNFSIGGYQPLQKWLKDRKGRCLTENDIIHYEKIVYAIRESIKIMREIDKIISI